MNHSYRNLLAAVLATAATCAVAQTPATITSWTTQTTVFPTASNAAQMAGAAIVGDYLYVLGGNSGADGDTSRTWRMFINKYNGFVGQAEEQAQLPGTNYAYISSQVATTGTAIYVAGGGYNSTNVNRNNVTIGKLNGSYQFGSGFTTAVFPGGYDPELGSAVITQAGYFYAFGGDSQSGSPLTYDTVVYAPVQPNGDLGAFNTTLALPDPDAAAPTGWWFPAACTVGNYIIAHPGVHSGTTVAGFTSNKIYVAATNPATGAITGWTEQVGAPLPQAAYGMQLLSVGNTVFAIGGRVSSTVRLNVVYRATFDPNTGTLGAWQTVDAQLPSVIWYHSAVYSAASKSIYITSQRSTPGILDQVWISSPLFTRDNPPAAAEKDWALYE